MNSEGIFNQDTFINYIRKSRWAYWQPHNWGEEDRRINRWTSFINLTLLLLSSLHLWISSQTLEATLSYPEHQDHLLSSLLCGDLTQRWARKKPGPYQPDISYFECSKECVWFVLRSTDVTKTSIMVYFTHSFCWNCDVQATPGQRWSQVCGCVQWNYICKDRQQARIGL